LEFEFKSVGSREPCKVFEQGMALSDLPLQKINIQQGGELSFLFRGKHHAGQGFITTQTVIILKNYHSRI